MGRQWLTLFFWAPKSLQMVTAAMKLKDAYSLEGKLWLPRQHIQKQRHYFANKVKSSQGYGFSSGHVWMWELDCEESWASKNWCFWTVVLEKMLESPLECKEIQPVHSEGDQPWDFFGRNDAEAETPVLWPAPEKSWLIGKDSDAGKDWGQEEKGTTEDEMASWHHLLYGSEFVWTPGVDDGQGGLASCNSWGHKESDTIERLNWTEIQSYEDSALCVFFLKVILFFPFTFKFLINFKLFLDMVWHKDDILSSVWGNPLMQHNLLERLSWSLKDLGTFV